MPKHAIVVVVDKNGLPVVNMKGHLIAFAPSSLVNSDECILMAQKHIVELNKTWKSGFFGTGDTMQYIGRPFRFIVIPFPILHELIDEEQGIPDLCN